MFTFSKCIICNQIKIIILWDIITLKCKWVQIKIILYDDENIKLNIVWFNVVLFLEFGLNCCVERSQTLKKSLKIFRILIKRLMKNNKNEDLNNYKLLLKSLKY